MGYSTTTINGTIIVIIDIIIITVVIVIKQMKTIISYHYHWMKHLNPLNYLNYSMNHHDPMNIQLLVSQLKDS